MFGPCCTKAPSLTLASQLACKHLKMYRTHGAAKKAVSYCQVSSVPSYRCDSTSYHTAWYDLTLYFTAFIFETHRIDSCFWWVLWYFPKNDIPLRPILSCCSEMSRTLSFYVICFRGLLSYHLILQQSRRSENKKIERSQSRKVTNSEKKAKIW